MNQLTKTFEGHDIRVVGEGEKILFVASDVAKALGYKEPHKAVSRHCKGDGMFRPVIDKLGREQETRVIRESDVYRLVTNSQLPAAEEFEMWVMEEVLPSIRKHGGYLTPEKVEEALLNPDTLIRLATDLKEERQKRIDAEHLVEAQKPKVLLADVIEKSDSAVIVRDFVKLISKRGYVIGEKRFFAWLRESKYIDRKNRPYQTYMDMGLFELTEYPVVRSSGTELRFTPRITGKGQLYFVNKLLGDSGLNGDSGQSENQIN